MLLDDNVVVDLRVVKHSSCILMESRILNHVPENVSDECVPAYCTDISYDFLFDGLSDDHIACTVFYLIICCRAAVLS